MAYNYRCSRSHSCGKRVTLPKKLEQYVNRPICRVCKKDSLRSVNSAEKARNKRRVCKCDGVPYPHRIGTEPWCDHAKIGPTEEDWQDRHRGY